MEKTYGTFLINAKDRPIQFGQVNLINPARVRLRGQEPKAGKICKSVVTGFCGTDWKLMRMGQAGKLTLKFPPGQLRLINGHEGVVWVPDEERYAIVLIRGGDAYDPARFESDESYFEYGCDGADGLMCEQNYYHPDMLLDIPASYLTPGQKLTRKLARRLVFSDPMACMLFQLERIEDLLAGHNWRLYAARGLKKEEAFSTAIKEGMKHIVIYGLGGTGILAVIGIKEKYPHSRIVTVGRSVPGGVKGAFIQKYWDDVYYVQTEPDPKDTVKKIMDVLDGVRPKVFFATSGNAVEADIAFKYDLLDNNGIYSSFSLGPRISFDTMPFGFKNHLIFGAINFRQDHMEAAIELLGRQPVDELVTELPLAGLKADPMAFYHKVFQDKGRALKSICVWDESLVE